MANRKIQVIPTEYNGILYRSRTEARWAVFMTTVGCPFEYEPEGFDLSGGVCYIPDFWLPTCGGFLEIKPTITTEDRESPFELFAIKTGFPIWVAYGQPEQVGGDLQNWQINSYQRCFEPYEHQCGLDEDYCFCRCPKCGRVEIQFNGRADRNKCACHKSSHGDKGYNWDDDVLMRGYYEAAQAFRFKRGGAK